MNAPTPAPWSEVFDGGSPETEREGFHALAVAMNQIQEKSRLAAGAAHAMRTLHAKILAGMDNAQLHVDVDLLDRFRVDYFVPGAIVAASVRFSNASSIPKPDTLPDMRGIAIKLLPDGCAPHDLLMTNYPVSHARNARQFVDFAVIATGDPATLKQRLQAHFGTAETARMLQTISQGMRRSAGLQHETFWNRGAMLWGDRPVRLILRPEEPGVAAEGGVVMTDEGLSEALAACLSKGSVRYRLAVQPFVSEASTPIEDAAVEWTESVSTPVEVATLVIPQQAILDQAGLATKNAIDELVFNPWNAPAAFRPLGNINRARGEVYGSSARHWARHG